MSDASYGDASRRPVFSGNRRVPGLEQRALADGRVVFEARLRLGAKHARRIVLDAQTKTDAILELQALRVDRHRGDPARTGSLVPTLDEVAADWLLHLELRTRHRDPAKRYSPRTVALYRQRLDQHVVPLLGHKQLDTISVADLRRLIDKLGVDLAPATVTGIVNMTSSLLQFAVKGRLVERNVVRDLVRDDRPGTARQHMPRWLSLEELDVLCAELSDTFRPIVEACLYAALRISEALGLHWADLDFDKKTIRIWRQLDDDGTVREATKTPSSTAMLPLLPALGRALREHRKRQAGIDLRRVHRSHLVFTTSRGKPQSRRNVLRAVHTAGTKAGLNPEGAQPVGLHDMRYSFVGLSLESASLPETSVLARHANPRVTAQLYAGVTDKAKSQLAAKLVRAGLGA
jgi:integrase